MLENKKIKSAIGSTTGMVAITSFSNIFVSLFNIIGGLIVAKLLLPEELGLFNSFSIFTSYIILMQMGIPSGLSREIPFNFGKGYIEKANQFAATSSFFLIFMSVGIALICCSVAIYYLVNKNYNYAFGSVIVAITCFQTLYVTQYLKVLYKTNKEFNLLALINIIVSLVSLFSIFFVWKLGFYGLGIRVFFTALINFLLSYKWRPIKVKPKWSTNHFKELFYVGAPIFFVANIYGLWPTIQRTVILSIGGTKMLGLYALASIIQNMLNIVNRSISSVAFPKMTYEYGKGKNFLTVMKIPLKFVKFSLIFFLIMIPIGWYILPIIVDSFLPNYVGGVKAAQWMLIVAFISIFAVFSNIYMVMKKNMDRLKAYIIGMFVWGISVYFMNQFHGFKLENFSIALLLGYTATYIVDFYFYKMYYKKGI